MTNELLNCSFVCRLLKLSAVVASSNADPARPDPVSLRAAALR